MPKMMRMRRRRGPRSGGPDDAKPYLGPIRLPTQSGVDGRVVKANLQIVQDLASDSFGILKGYVTPGDITGSTDWPFYEGIYDEFRILGVQMTWIPRANGSFQTTLLPSTGVIAAVHTPLTGAPTSANIVVQHATWGAITTYNSWKKEWRKRGIEESGFFNTSSPATANHGGLIWFADGLSTSIIYGRVVYTFLAEFRSRK